jgi:DNA-directed RNA polymerase subunit RPC12/RpoP
MPHALIPVIVIAVVFCGQLTFQRFLTSKFDYLCSNCGQRFTLTPFVASIAPHRFGGSKYVRCPHCGTRSWVSPVPKQ